MNIVKATYITKKDMIVKSQQLKVKLKIIFYEYLSNYYDGINIWNFEFDEDTFSKNAQGIKKIYYKVFMLMKI